MLPSSGYFQSINCPFYDSGLCDRSYCHYRHVKKDANNSSKECGGADLGTSSILDVGENRDILQQLVSEAVKKALQDTELTSSIEGDAGNSNGSGGTEEVSSKLVEKVIEGLKPLVARSPPPLPAPTVTTSIPSYKPTPISELRKRHIPVPYTPKDTKTIVVKRHTGVDSLSHLARVKSVSSKRREEYVPATSGKAMDSEKSSYKPYSTPSYGEVCYSPTVQSDSAVTSEISYTPSDKSSLPIKTSDYVPTGISDTLLPNAFYKPTNRGDSPAQEPEYQPDSSLNSSKFVSYIPSKLENARQDNDLKRNNHVLSPEDSSSLSSPISESSAGNIQNDHPAKQFSSTKHALTNSKMNVNSESIYSEIQSGASELSVSDSSHSSCVHIKSKSDSKEKDKSKSSSKHSLYHKVDKNHVSLKEHKDGKGRNVIQDHQKNGKNSKDTKHHRENIDKKDSRSSKDSKCQGLVKDGHVSKDMKHIRNEFHDKSDVHKTLKGSKEAKDRHKRRTEDEHDGKPKRLRQDLSEGTDHKKKGKTGNLSSKTECKLKSEVSHHKHSKDTKISDGKHSTSHSKNSGSTHSNHKIKSKHKSESVGSKRSTHEPEVSCLKKSKSNSSGHSNNKKSEPSKSLPDTSVCDMKKQPHAVDSFKEMEALIQERLQERDYQDCMSIGDSDTDEDIRTEECLRIFNSYKPEVTQDLDETDKKAKLGEKEPEAIEVGPPVKKRLAHEGAAFLPKRTIIPRKSFDPAMAMVNRLTKAKEQVPELHLARAKVHLPETPPTNAKEHTAEAPFLQPKTLAGKRRIAHVPNVTKLLDAKEKIYAVVNSSKTEPTKSQTVPKGGQRVAHMPPKEVTCRPLISSVDGTKIPTNVRQKYCSLMFDELLKKVESAEDCCRLALEEEESCYARSSSRNVYVNLAIISIQRLRNWIAPQGKDDLSGGSKLTVSHENVIGGKSKAQGLWSIIPPKKLPGVLDESTAYQLMLEKYVMSEEELVENGYPRTDPNEKGKAIMMETNFRIKTKSKNFHERICDRCGKEFFVDEKGIGNPEDQCTFHWGRAFKTRRFGELETRYSCCQGEARSEGCTMWNCHISEMFDPENQRGFVQTLEKPDAVPGKVYSLDCEMCYTTDGLELVRVTVINYDGDTVYDTLVKPENVVLDYATRFSGIDENAMKGVKTTIFDVQATLLSLFDKKTILIGHSLDSDLKALKLIHNTVVDTSLVFPHRRGPPFKRALKTLCAEILRKLIQTGEEGHDSAEDAVACIELMKWRLKEDLKAK